MKLLLPALLVAGLFAPGLLAPASLLRASSQAAPSGTTAQAPTSTLVIQVTGIRNQRGDVRYAIFTSPDGFPANRDKAYRYGSLPANGGTLTFTISNLPEGSYGIAVFHDENSNHKVDRDLFGRPKEGIGYGNNPKIGFPPPNWKQSTVHVAGASIQSTVDMRYP